MNHTPGPYQIEDASENLTYPIYKVVKKIDGLRSVIATCADMVLCDEHGGTVIGNAHLIAAAPELLEACKELMRIQIVHHNFEFTPVRQEAESRVVWDAMNQAELAITKAEGKG